MFLVGGFAGAEQAGVFLESLLAFTNGVGGG